MKKILALALVKRYFTQSTVTTYTVRPLKKKEFFSFVNGKYVHIVPLWKRISSGMSCFRNITKIRYVLVHCTIVHNV